MKNSDKMETKIFNYNSKEKLASFVGLALLVLLLILVYPLQKDTQGNFMTSTLLRIKEQMNRKKKLLIAIKNDLIIYYQMKYIYKY